MSQGDILYLDGPYRFKFFKGSLPQILLDPFLNTLTQIKLQSFLEVFSIRRRSQDPHTHLRWIVINDFNYCCKVLYLSCLLGFWLHL